MATLKERAKACAVASENARKKTDDLARDVLTKRSQHSPQVASDLWQARNNLENALSLLNKAVEVVGLGT